MYSANGGNGQDITAGTNTTPAVMPPSLPLDGTLNRRGCLYYHHRMARPSDVDVSIINVGWYTNQALLYTFHHRPMVRPSSVDASTIITVGWYARPGWYLRHHRRMVRQTDIDVSTSLPDRMPTRRWWTMPPMVQNRQWSTTTVAERRPKLVMKGVWYR